MYLIVFKVFFILAKCLISYHYVDKKLTLLGLQKCNLIIIQLYFSKSRAYIIGLKIRVCSTDVYENVVGLTTAMQL